MNKIKVLPEEVARKIAAGEVIERPVSVVKELVENSLDAGALEIRISLESGGKSLIRVQDNGCGMTNDDAAVCFRRHSTSKISTETDLGRISTLGFRGEALASISSVAKVVLKTSDGSSGRGLMIEREGEKLISVTDIAFPRGTTIEVRNLFFNLPARRKFLRSDQTELSLAVKTISQFSLAYPEVRFVLTHGSRQLIDCPAVKTRRERIFQLFGKTTIDSLMEISETEDGRRLDGLSSLPLSGRTDRSRQFFFVNRRPARDRTFIAALAQAYAGLLEKNRHPEAYFFFTLPFEEVDVNVHPAKAEVRFADPQAIFRLILRSIEKAKSAVSLSRKVYEAWEKSSPGLIKEESNRADVSLSFGQGHSCAATADFDIPAAFYDKAKNRADISSAADAGVSDSAVPGVLGQLDNVYIVAARPGEIVVIDQHNAHERVLYEKFKDIDRNKAWSRTRLVLPILVEVSPSEVLCFEANARLFDELGFDADLAGERTIAIKEYPDVFSPDEAKDVFLNLLNETKQSPEIELRDRCLATYACRKAVKAGEPLGLEKMRFLVEMLFQTTQPFLCPHGRPVIVRWSKEDIDRKMKRPA